MDAHNLLKIQQLLSFLSTPPLSPGPGQPHEQEHLDVVINKLENILALLKRRRNTLSPITRLSSDILLHIFRYLQPHTPKFGPIGRDGTAPFAIFGTRPANAAPELHEFQWMREITHVCAHWRDLSMNSPTLWTTIRFHHPKWTVEVLRRSLPAPLSIIFDREDGGDESGDTVLALQGTLLNHLGRARHLDIAVPYLWFDAFISQNLPLITDSLQTCLFHGLPKIGRAVPNRELPVTFLQNCATSLRYLALSSCSLSSQTPNDTVHLENLSHLVLQNSVLHCVGILDRISFHPTCQIMIDCFHHFDELQPLHPIIRRFWSAKAEIGKPLKEINFTPALRGDVVDVMARDYFQGPDDPSERESERWYYCLTLRVRIASSDVLQSLWKTFPMLDEVITFSVDIFLDPDWQSLSAFCPNIQHLSLADSDLDGLFDVLGDQVDEVQPDSMVVDSETPSTDDLRFPNLKTITFGQSVFTDQLSLRFVACLKRRHQMGRPVHRVFLYSAQGVHWTLVDEANKYTLEEADCDCIEESDGEE
ncbi:hypothetical protein BDN72DRAFT_836445 [Pluteus cervinus]|uniref:Uncharacterized protein n=1 Tax=Pluteus cervinus TaxID=181527 RepID=A0ACD3B2L7_9AGAR|nr:hypothetical protein BDN72DRAFT_836445 [Pluteus cervinus]